MWNRSALSPLLPLAFVLASLFAPAMWGVALNQETRECAGYWGGDEFTHYPLPPGWEAYYPDEDGVIYTDAGVCQLPAQDCCQQLGYTFVAENIGEKYKTETTLQPIACLCPFSILGLLATTLIVIYLIKRTLRRGRTPRWLQTIKLLWKDNTTRMLSVSMIVASILTAVSLAAMWICLDLISWGHWGFFPTSILFLVEFYSQGTISVATVLWYLGALLLLALCWKLTEQLKIEWIRTLVRTALVALLLSPGAFVYTGVHGPDMSNPGVPPKSCTTWSCVYCDPLEVF